MFYFLTLSLMRLEQFCKYQKPQFIPGNVESEGHPELCGDQLRSEEAAGGSEPRRERSSEGGRRRERPLQLDPGGSSSWHR